MNPFLIAQQQIDAAATILKLDPSITAIIKEPQRLLEVSIPVKMDDGRIKVFKGFRSQHNNARGPYKGGIRYHPNVTRDEVNGYPQLRSRQLWLPPPNRVHRRPCAGGVCDRA